MNQDPIEQIEINLRAETLNQRKEALDELAEFPAEIAVPVLQRLVSEKDFGLRRLAVMGFGNYTTEASFQTLKQIIEQEQDPNVLAEAANSVFEFGDRAVPILQKLFEVSDNWLVRQTVISLLVETDCYEILLSVAKLALQDETETVKQTGISALGQLLNSSVKDRALDLLTQLAGDENWRSRWKVAYALQHSQDLQARGLIAKLQQDENYRVVAAALEVASDWGEK